MVTFATFDLKGNFLAQHEEIIEKVSASELTFIEPGHPYFPTKAIQDGVENINNLNLPKFKYVHGQAFGIGWLVPIAVITINAN